MSYDRVRLKMGGEGMKSLTQFPAAAGTSVANYRDPSFDVYESLCIDRRPEACAVLVRASMPLLLANVGAHRSLRRAAPEAKISDGLHGFAVWVTNLKASSDAHRPRPSWWAAEGWERLFRLETRTWPGRRVTRELE
jgi:hypothetical protein